MEYCISTPVEIVSEGKCDAVYLPGANGDWGVLPGHTRSISLLRKGVVTVWQEGRENSFPCERGLAKVNQDRVDVILVEQL